MELADRVIAAERPEMEDRMRLRSLLAATPEDILPDCSVTHRIRNDLAEKLGRWNAQSTFILAETDRLKRDLGYSVSPALEQLLIDHILTLRLQHLHAEQRYNETVVLKQGNSAAITYGNKHLSATQTRFLKAVETLAKVRRMTRDTPAVQINVAREGGQQINVQGEQAGQRAAG